MFIVPDVSYLERFGDVVIYISDVVDIHNVVLLPHSFRNMKS